MTSDETTMRTTTTTCRLSATLLMLVGGFAAAADEQTFSPEDVTFYETQVKPILDESCLKCHGGEKTKAELRVTSRGALLRGGETGPGVDVENPKKSLLLKMINYSDDDHQMPPKQKLPADKIAIITEWVKKGMPWTPGVKDEHAVAKKPLINDETRNYWAYKKPLRPEVPKVGNAKWVSNPIDAFILADLDRQGLKPAPPASAEALIRRAHYDLIGLPPSAAEVAEFAASKDPKAYEQVIEKLLASPHYGEKWGRHWLDVVGYADTNGYERDGNKPHVWRYRDYVVKAINQDKPYDRFVQEQLAGDELADKDADSVTATGFYRLGLWDDEPADRELAKYDNLDRIVSTVGGGMLGMALGCARCHDHKRDPIAQEDYHRMVGFFNNIKHMNNGGPDIETKVSSAAADKAAWEQRISVLDKEVAAAEQAFKAKLPQELRAAAEVVPGFRKLSFRQYKGRYEHLPEFDKLEVERKGEIADGMIDPGIAGRESDYGFVFEGELEIPSAGSYTFRLDSDDGSRLIINGKRVLEMDGIHGMQGYQNATVQLKTGKARVRLDYFQAVGGRGLKMLWSGSAIGTRPLVKGTEVEAGAAMDLAQLMDERATEILGAATYASYRSARRELNHLRANPVGDYTALSITEQGGVADNWVLARGNPQAKTKKIDPGFPEVLGFAAAQLPSGVKGRRTVLAEWIVHPDNPLTARVMVNRLWQHHFGRGIVGSSNDFGQLGEQPTNQPLLDWLALEFIERKWSMKAMHRLIMTSSAYRMSSQDDAAALAKDAGNLHLWRYNMRRLTAEEIRDSILTVDGSLNLAIGGPAVFPPMPKEVLATSSQPHNAWGKSSPDDEVRRSIYIKVKRSLVHPMLSMHDFADTDQSCPVRFATTVPTQALTMLNSEFINERAAAFAQRLVREEPKSLDAQVKLALKLVMQREPKPAEIKRGTTFVNDLRTGEKLSADDSLTVFCLMALNLNEFVFLD
ncbi:MAG: DUF1553 domain-containing protein [Planctomycetes bacterium]|nr:DUF1553 domain-containing protein [Planctomycetota bacterium]